MAWYNLSGTSGDSVICTRVSLYRNIEKYPFIPRLDAKSAAEINETVGGMLESNGFEKTDFSEITPAVACSYVEKLYVSPDFALQNIPHALYINEPCNLAVAICDEEHICIRCILPGLSPTGAYANVCKAEELIDRGSTLAFDEKLGYLTANLTLLGTGLDVSAMLFIPFLALSGQLSRMSVCLRDTGISLSGVYGDAYEGGICAVSVRPEPGVTEEAAISRLEEAVAYISAAESRLRDFSKENDYDQLTDRIRRSFGTACYSYLLTSAELMNILSDLRTGLMLGITDGYTYELMNSLMIETMPATLTQLSVDPIRNETERCRCRAAVIRKAFNPVADKSGIRASS